MTDYFSYILLNKIVLFPLSFYNLRYMTTNSSFSLRRVSVVCKQLFNVFHVSCLSTWAWTKFSSTDKNRTNSVSQVRTRAKVGTMYAGNRTGL